MLSAFVLPIAYVLAVVKRDPRAYVAVPLVAAIAALAVFARRLTRAARHGDVELRLAKLPLAPGESFDALLIVPGGLDGDVRARLACRVTTAEGYGRDRRYSTRDLHEQARSFGPIERAQGSAVPISFRIPASLPGCDDHGHDQVKWLLEVSGAGRRRELDELFLLPVFVTARREDVESHPLGA